MESEFYLELIAKELSGEISETEKSSLLEWIKRRKEMGVLSSPLLNLYLTIGTRKNLVSHSIKQK